MPVVSAAAQRSPLPALHQSLPAGGSVAGDVPASQPVSTLTVALKRTPAQQADLDDYLKAVRTVGSADYHHWLTPAQFAARFAPAAADVAPVQDWLTSQGFAVTAVSPGGMRLSVSGTAAQVVTAFGVKLQRYAMTSGDSVAIDGTPSVPDALAGAVLAVGGLDAAAAPAVDAVAALETSVDANTSAVLLTDLTAATVSAEELNAVLEQASAQGQTVVALHAAVASLPVRALVLVAPDAVALDTSANVTPRPDWQIATGLPADTLRATPDAAVADANALATALQQVVTKGGSRQGEAAATFYKLAPVKDVFAHADPSVASGTWTAVDGLGTVDVTALVKAWPYGAVAPDSSTISLSNHTVVHGANIILTATIAGTSGTPTGSVQFASSQGGPLGSPVALDATGVAVLTTNTLAGGLYGFYGTYTGDTTYAGSTTNVDTATVNAEAATITGAVASTTAFGGSIPVLVTVTSASGIGTPTGTVTVYPYGTNVGTSTFTGTLASVTAGTATATVAVPASNVGSFTFQTNCTTSASFSCYQPASFAVTVGKATPVVTLAQSGTTAAAVLTATVAKPTGASASVSAPTGNVQFMDGTTSLGSFAVNSAGTASYNGPLSTAATHSVTASYGGDDNYVSASSNATPVTKVTPLVTLAATSTTAGAPLSATVAAPAGTTSPGVATGNVTFLDGTTSLGIVALNSAGVATYTGTYSTATGHSITATYPGDTNYNTAVSNVLGQAAKVVPTAVLSGTTTAGTTNLSVTVAPPTGTTTVPTGSVQFLDGTTPLATQPLSAAGIATYAATLSTTTTHSITASYLGDGTFSAVVSNAVTAGATALIATTTSLTSSSGYSGPFGTSFTLVSVVTPASYVAAGTAPTGTITITDAGVTVGTGSLVSGTATIPVTTLTVGAHNLIATYSGDTNYAASTTTVPVVITVTPVTATVAATISPTGSVPYGYNATLNVTVTSSGTVGLPGTVTATVSGGNGSYTGTLAVTTGSVASTAAITFPVPPPGTYTITVSCNGSLTCTTPATVRLTTTKGFTTTTLTTLTPTSPQAGTPVSVSATVANSGTGTGTYTYSGTVSFYSNGKFLASAPVSNGVATGTITFLSTVAQTVTAIYSGDVNWTGSTSQGISVTPTPLPTSISLTSSTLNGIVGQNITLTAALSSGQDGVALIPTGSVTFYDTYNSIVVNLGSAPLLSNGLSTSYAQISTTGLRPGAHNIMVVYTGDAVFEKATSTTIIVNIGDFTLTFLPSILNVTAGNTGTGTLAIGSVNGFTGQIALGCTPPPGTLTTCTITPSVASVGSTAQFTVTTTRSTATAASTAPRIAVAALLGGALSLCFMRRRRVAALLLLLVVAMVAAGGCTQVAATDTDTIGGGTGSGGGNGTTNNGTPLGTLSLTITAASVDSPVNARHTYLVPVTVQ